MANHAEKNEPFIRYFLEKIGTCEDLNVYGVDQTNLPNTCGVYVFYLKHKPAGEERFPIYVGVASESFRQRCQEQARPGGLIYKLTSGEFPRNYRNMGLHAYLVSFPAIVSRFVESVLLETFDFCLNEDGNSPPRKDLDTAKQLTVEESKQNFDILWNGSLTTIRELEKMYKK